MASRASDRVRTALERLDQAIDRLEARVAARPSKDSSSSDDSSANIVLADRLDRVIERIESALAG